ncbi:MAG: hypothetical protein IPP57_01585 [Candidatus Obscuribacter sp.]|jgi:hypothetical protein|nr:hypothetical protein [Candidatus Obscuribacter sp.]MBK9619081.1 hypothetical protein [Candidatus Obscuribacter sp.]MBK9769517.1 hypothetical protein [Candidatus Obscuribacter sp.]MDQ5968073.1 hypothetical protein [Cyanobacteriota bacterium erpe_2018_sw_39hr_WHONDRS-SW48-000098_B_bin.30]
MDEPIRYCQKHFVSAIKRELQYKAVVNQRSKKKGLPCQRSLKKKADKSVDYLHPDGKVPTKPKTEEEKVNKEQAEDSTQLARKLEEKDAR